jgi:hypothetical protein
MSVPVDKLPPPIPSKYGSFWKSLRTLDRFGDKAHFLINDYRYFTSWTGLIASIILYSITTYFVVFYVSNYFDTFNTRVKMSDHYGTQYQLDFKTWDSTIGFKLHKDNSTYQAVEDYLIIQGTFTTQIRNADSVTSTPSASFRFVPCDTEKYIDNTNLYSAYDLMENAWCLPTNIDLIIIGTVEDNQQTWLTVDV